MHSSTLKKQTLKIYKKFCRKFTIASYLLLYNRKGFYDRLKRYKAMLLPQENDPWRFEAEIGRIQNTLLFQSTMTDTLLADLKNIEKKVTENVGNTNTFSRKYTLMHACASIKNLTEKGAEKDHSERNEDAGLNETEDMKPAASPSTQHDD
jgi:hypothetical protein